MTDEEILELALVHATCFTSCVQFSDQDLIAFARELLGRAAPPEQESESEREMREMDRLWKLYEAHRRSV